MGSSKGRRRTEFVGMWLLPEEKAALAQAARDTGSTIGDAVRASLAMTRDAGPRASDQMPRATELAARSDDPAADHDCDDDPVVRDERALKAAGSSQIHKNVVLAAAPGAEAASDIAMVVLAQLCYQLFECQLVLEALPYEVDLDLDEFARDISAAQQSARQAYSAASLLHKNATLDDRCDPSPSRPGAIIARHQAAVAAGAPRVVPDVSRTDQFNDGLNKDRRRDRGQRIIGLRPTCKAALRDGSRRCTKNALYLGDGTWAPHCYVHATTADRDRSRERERAGIDSEKDDERTRKEVRRVFGHAVMFGWADAHDEASQAPSAATARRTTRRRSEPNRSV